MTRPAISALIFFISTANVIAAIDIQPTPLPAAQNQKIVARAPGTAGQACQDHFYFRPKKTPGIAANATDLRACAEVLLDEVRSFRDRRSDVKASKQTGPNAHDQFFSTDSLVVEKAQLDFASDNSVSLYLFKAHTFYKRLKEWEKAVSAARPSAPADTPLTAADRVALQRLFDTVSATIHDVMDGEGLRELFSTALDTGVAWADAGNSVIPSARDTGETQARGLLGFESKHFGDDSSWFDVSVGGSLGFVPALSLVRVRSAEPGAALSAPQTIYQQAFIWGLSPRLNIPLGGFTELSLFGRIGQTRLTSDTESFKRGDNSLVAERISNNAGRTEHYLETGFEYKLFERPTDIVHHEKSFLLPALFVAWGYRKDNRFRTGGDGFDDLTIGRDRMFYRMGVSLNRLLDLRKKDVKSEKFSFRFVVDHDRPLRGSQVPHATRFFFGGDLDLLKVIKGE